MQDDVAGLTARMARRARNSSYNRCDVCQAGEEGELQESPVMNVLPGRLLAEGGRTSGGAALDWRAGEGKPDTWWWTH